MFFAFYKELVKRSRKDLLVYSLSSANTLQWGDRQWGDGGVGYCIH
jgi:hypothetical protein